MRSNVRYFEWEKPADPKNISLIALSYNALRRLVNKMIVKNAIEDTELANHTRGGVYS